MQRLLPPSVFPSPSPSPEIEIEEGNPPASYRSNFNEKEAPAPEMKSAKPHPPGLKGGCADESHMKRINKPALQTRSVSSPSRGQVYSRQTLSAADIMHGESDRDIGIANDVFMNDLDALLRF
jgi:hypothetical protein